MLLRSPPSPTACNGGVVGASSTLGAQTRTVRHRVQKTGPRRDGAPIGGRLSRNSRAGAIDAMPSESAMPVGAVPNATFFRSGIAPQRPALDEAADADRLRVVLPRYVCRRAGRPGTPVPRLGPIASGRYGASFSSGASDGTLQRAEHNGHRCARVAGREGLINILERAGVSFLQIVFGGAMRRLAACPPRPTV